MKNLVLTLALVLMSSAAQAAYDFVKKPVELCPGTALNVYQVVRVGLSRAGGCCGTDEEWSPEGERGFIEMPDFGRRGPVSYSRQVWILHPRDMRGEFQASLRGFNIASLGWDPSFARLIDPSVGLMEKIGLRDSKISVCISRIDLVRVNQTHATGTVVDFALGFKVFLNSESSEGRKSLLVQELGGAIQVKSNFYHMYIHTTPRPAGLLTNSWPSIQSNFDKFLKPVPNPEADQNIALVRADMADYIGR